MDIAIQVALLVLVIVAIIMVVRLVMVLGKAGKAIDSINEAATSLPAVIGHADEAVTKAIPVIEGLEATLSDVRVPVQRIDPLLSEATDALGNLSCDLDRLGLILDDVNNISKPVSSAATNVKDSAQSIMAKARKLLRSEPAGAGIVRAEQVQPACARFAASQDAPAVEPAAVADVPEVVNTDKGYFVYPSK